MILRSALLFVLVSTLVSSATVTVKITDKVVSKPIPPNFAGFSIEVPSAMGMVGQHPAPPKPAFVQLVKNLCVTPGQPGTILRIGGNSADESWWNPNHLPRPAGIKYDITEHDLLSVDNSVREFNGSWVPGVIFKPGNNASWALNHLNAIAKYTGWSHVSAIEIGNEVDLFAGKIRPANWTYEDYLKEFKFYAESIYAQTTMPKKHIQGATYAGKEVYEKGLPSYMQTNLAFLKTVSYHRYPENKCTGHPTIDGLMADRAAMYMATAMEKYIVDADSLGLKYYIGESNSVACGGMKNVSDVLAATLWATDFMFNLAKVGAAGINFHGGPHGIYGAINFDYKDINVPDVRPLYYAMWLFATTTSHHSVLIDATVDTEDEYIKAWTVKNRDSYMVVIIHKNYKGSAASVVVTPPTETQTSANLKVLKGKDGIYSHYGITYGGQTFDGTKDGLPVGKASPVHVICSSGNYEFVVEPATIAVLEIQKA